MLSVIPSIVVLGLVALAALLLALSRPSPPEKVTERHDASHALALAVGVQTIHFAEETATSFHERLPTLFSLTGTPLSVFVAARQNQKPGTDSAIDHLHRHSFAVLDQGRHEVAPHPQPRRAVGAIVQGIREQIGCHFLGLRRYDDHSAPERGGRSWRHGVGALLLASACFLCACRAEPVVTPSQLAEATRRQLGDLRPTIGRLSIDLGFVPCRAAGPIPDPRWLLEDRQGEGMDCGSALSRTDHQKLLAVRRVSLSHLDDMSPEALHTQALWRLLLSSNENNLRRVETLLEAALERAPDDPAVLNDLGVVRFERALRGEPWRLVAALDDVRRAESRQPNSPTARFNSALVTSALNLRHVARDAWASYLAVADDEPDWRREGQARRAQVFDLDLDDAFEARIRQPPASAEDAERLVEEFPHRAAGYLIEDLLLRWAEAFSARARDAAYWLQAVDRLAEALARGQGDRAGTDIVAHIRDVPHEAARSLALLGAGQAKLRKDDIEGAAAAFRSLIAAKGVGGIDPIAAWALAWLGLVAIYQGDHATAADRLAEAEGCLDAQRHPTILGRVLWHRGLSLARLGRDAEALQNYRRAEAVFSQLRDGRSSAAMEYMQSEMLEALGRPQLAWNKLLAALARLADHPRYAQLHNVLFVATDTLAADSLAGVGGAFADEMSAVGKRANESLMIAEAAQQRAVLLAMTGNLTAARDALSDASSAAVAIGDEDFRQRVETGIELEAAQLATRFGRQQDADDFSPLITFYTARNEQHRVLETYLGRVRRWQSLGDPRRARADLDTALAISLAKNRSLDEISDRLAHSDVVHEIFAELVSLHAARSEALDSLVYAECARLAPYRGWIDALPGSGGASDCDAVRPLLEERLHTRHPDEKWLLYLTLEERLLVWTLDSDGLRLTEQAVSRRDLERAVRAVIRAVNDQDFARLCELSRGLWDLLGLPGEQESRPSTRLFLLPDGTLGRLPFAALIHPATGRYLVESHILSYGASILATSGASLESASGHGGSSLLVADPAFDPQLSGLKALRAARDEVSAIEGIVDRPRTLVGLEATRESVVEGLSEATIFHYAGHALANAENPFDSYLLLAAPGAPPVQQTLRADELLNTAMPNLRLAVLSACETANAGAGSAAPAAGLAGLAMPFLLRGSIDVVATLQNVEDRAAAALMTIFHQERAAGLATADALRAAQLELLHGEDPALRAPDQWAWAVAFD